VCVCFILAKVAIVICVCHSSDHILNAPSGLSGRLQSQARNFRVNPLALDDDGGIVLLSQFRLVPLGGLAYIPEVCVAWASLVFIRLSALSSLDHVTETLGYNMMLLLETPTVYSLLHITQIILMAFLSQEARVLSVHHVKGAQRMPLRE